jgi:hypothetical protein
MSISPDIQSVIRNFVSFVGFVGDGDKDKDKDEDEDEHEHEHEHEDGDRILFEIFLHADDIAVDIQPFSAHPDESEILIAASTVFRIKKVCE